MNRVTVVVGLFVFSGVLFIGGVVSFLAGFELAPVFLVFGCLLALVSTILGALLFALEDT